MMARPELQPGTWGTFTHKTTSDGRIRTRVNYRRVDGTRGRTETVAKSKNAGERALLAKLPSLVAQSRLLVPEQAPATFDELAPEWLEEEKARYEQGDLARGTYNEHQRLMQKVVLPAFAGMTLTDITPRHVNVAYKKWVAKWPPQARLAKGILNQVLGHATSMGYIDRNPALEVKSIRRKRKEIFAPGINELNTFREAVISHRDDPERPGPQPSPLLLDVIDIILATGVRISEALGLRWDDDVFLDAPKPFIVVNGAIKEKGGPKRWEPMPKTEAGIREIEIPDYAVAILLRRMVANTSGSQFVFHTRTGAPNGPQDVHRALRSVRAHAGLPDDYVPHALRRSVGTAVANTMGLEAAAGLLGHERSRVTEQSYAKRAKEAPDVRAILQAHFDLVSRRS